MISLKKKTTRKKRGAFIVIEGTDGSGKATQTKLLTKAFKKNGRKVESIAFPQYGKHSAAPIEAYLNGEYGSLQEVGPYRASIFYAIDRVTARSKIGLWLKEGKVVIADRYMVSNLAFQGAKIPGWNARKKFWMWEEEFEYDLLGIPRPDLTIILIVPPRISQDLILKKNKRAYLKKGKKDIHEKDLRYQEKVVKIYQELATFDHQIRIINCAPDGYLLPIEAIHDLIMKTITKEVRHA